MGVLPSPVCHNRHRGRPPAACYGSFSEQARARIKAARLEAGADLLGGLAAFWRGIGMSSKALRKHDPAELMTFFERYAEKQFDAEAKELLACFPDPEAYSLQLILLPMKVALRICPSSGIILPENVGATEWTDLYRALKAALNRLPALGCPGRFRTAQRKGISDRERHFPSWRCSADGARFVEAQGVQRRISHPERGGSR
jgi:hypothetical protein